MPKKPRSPSASALDAAIGLFREQGGTLRTNEAIALGIHPRTLYAMRDAGILDQLSRGLFRLADLPPLGHPDLVPVALRVPDGVFCLLSALSLHDLTTQIPHEVYLALPRGADRPRLDHPPLRAFWFTGRAFSEGIEEVYEATTKAVEQLEYVATESRKDATSALVVARDSQDDKITIKLKATPEGPTEVSIRVGTWGSERRSNIIYDKIKENLEQ